MASMYRVGGAYLFRVYLFRVFGEGLEDLLTSLDAISQQQIFIYHILMNRSRLFSLSHTL